MERDFLMCHQMVVVVPLDHILTQMMLMQKRHEDEFNVERVGVELEVSRQGESAKPWAQGEPVKLLCKGWVVV